MNGIYLLLGTNIGNRLEHLRNASRFLEKNHIFTLEESSIYETAAWGIQDQAPFLNLVLEVETSFDPKKLLQKVLEIETKMGRERKEKWGERLIDIDILYYNEQIVNEEQLKIPHPGIPMRRFTLIPLKEVNPFGTHPVLKKNHLELLAECEDQLACIETDFKL